jgi:HrpA-like RNA helicase
MAKKLGLAPGGPSDDDGVAAFLAKAIDPPNLKSVSNALELLVDIGAMVPGTNDLTLLGRCLSGLSLEPRVGKMVIWSYLLGCANASSNMAVAMSSKSPFVLPPPSLRRDAELAQIHLSRNSESDQVTVLNALIEQDHVTQGYGGASQARDFCRDNFLNPATMQMISDLRTNLTRELASLGFPNPSNFRAYHNRHDISGALWQAAIAAGLYPNVAWRERGNVDFWTITEKKATIHASSVNALKGQPLNSKSKIPEGQAEFVCFGELVRGANAYTMSQTSHLTSPLPLLLLCGKALSVRACLGAKEYSILSLDDSLEFTCDRKLATGIVILRKRLESAFWITLSDPSAGMTRLSQSERDAVEILGAILQSAHKSTLVRKKV